MPSTSTCVSSGRTRFSGEPLSTMPADDSQSNAIATASSSSMPAPIAAARMPARRPPTTVNRHRNTPTIASAGDISPSPATAAATPDNPIAAPIT